MPGAGAVVTMGTFDGVHPGHVAILQRVLKAARADGGEAVVITFHPHPRLVLQPQDRELQLLQTLAEKTERMRVLGIDKMLVIPFTPQFAATDSEDFIRKVLAGTVQARKVIVGYDHRFGRGRGGGLAELRELGPQLGFEVEEIPAQEIDDAKVSSTRIRQELLDGHIEQANRLLGYAYPLQGTVVHGNKRGRTIGYPTANLQLTDRNKLLPAQGVYAVQVAHGGTVYAGMMNIGTRPTVDGRHVVPEVHLLHYSGDLYDQVLEVRFVARIRSEQKFDGLEALKAQLQADAEATERLLAQAGNALL